MGGENNVSNLTLDRFTNDNGVGSNGGVAIEMGTNINADNITLFKSNRVLGER